MQALAAIVGYALCGFLIDWYGRRPVLFLYYFVGAFFHLWFAYASGMWLYVAIAAVGWVNPGVYGSTGIYVSELHPTHMRATAVGWFFGIGRIGSFLAPAVVGFMLHWGAGAYVLHTFALTFLIASIALWFVGVETKGKTLEEITARRGTGDGPDQPPSLMPASRTTLPHFVGLGGDEAAEFLRRVFLEVDVERLEPRHDVGLAQHLVQAGVELLDDLRRRAGRHEHAVPLVGLEARDGVLHRRQIGQGAEPAPAGVGDRLDLAAVARGRPTPSRWRRSISPGPRSRRSAPAPPPR